MLSKEFMIFLKDRGIIREWLESLIVDVLDASARHHIIEELAQAWDRHSGDWEASWLDSKHMGVVELAKLLKYTYEFMIENKLTEEQKKMV